MDFKTIVVGDEAALLAALRVASGETIIKLKAGLYETVNFNNINTAAKITVMSADLNNKAVFDIMSVNNSSNLTFQDLIFRHAVPDNLSMLQVRVSGSRDIAFIRNEFMGKVDNSNLNDAGGVMFSNSSRISVIDNNFHDLRVSLYALRTNDVIIAGNDVSRVREGFNFSDVDHVKIDSNAFSNFLPLLSGTRPDHPDAIQFWTSASTGSTDVDITNNTFLFANNLPIQGILIGNEQGDAARHSDFVIANNLYHGQSRHGISVYYADGVQITGNTVVTAPKAGTAQYLDPAIATTNTTGAVVHHNVAGLLLSTRDTGRVAYDNIDAWDTNTRKGVAYADLFDKVPTGNSVAADFRFKAGSVADLLDAGYVPTNLSGAWTGQRFDMMLDHPGSTHVMG